MAKRVEYRVTAFDNATDRLVQKFHLEQPDFKLLQSVYQDDEDPLLQYGEYIVDKRMIEAIPDLIPVDDRRSGPSHPSAAVPI